MRVQGADGSWCRWFRVTAGFRHGTIAGVGAAGAPDLGLADGVEGRCRKPDACGGDGE